MRYLHIDTSSYPLTEVQIRAELRNVSFPADPVEFNKCLKDFGYAPVQGTERPETTYKENIVEGKPLCMEGVWYQTWRIEPASEQEQKERTLNQSEEVKYHRNNLLKESDWTQLPDSKVDKEEWASYRQELRDLPTQKGFPWEVNWPTPPGKISNN